jgi:hypothetical protein
MNRRDFLKRGATGAAAVAIATIPVTSAAPKSDFPETKEEMVALVNAAKESKKYSWRMEGAFVEEGLSRTDTISSTHWYYHKGGRIAVLHLREADNHICFNVERMEGDGKITYLPPYPRR